MKYVLDGLQLPDVVYSKYGETGIHSLISRSNAGIHAAGGSLLVQCVRFQALHCSRCQEIRAFTQCALCLHTGGAGGSIKLLKLPRSRKGCSGTMPMRLRNSRSKISSLPSTFSRLERKWFHSTRAMFVPAVQPAPSLTRAAIRL